MYTFENVSSSNLPTSGKNILNSEMKYQGLLHLQYTHNKLGYL